MITLLEVNLNVNSNILNQSTWDLYINQSGGALADTNELASPYRDLKRRPLDQQTATLQFTTKLSSTSTIVQKIYKPIQIHPVPTISLYEYILLFIVRMVLLITIDKTGHAFWIWLLKPTCFLFSYSALPGVFQAYVQSQLFQRISFRFGKTYKMSKKSTE